MKTSWLGKVGTFVLLSVFFYLMETVNQLLGNFFDLLKRKSSVEV